MSKSETIKDSKGLDYRTQETSTLIMPPLHVITSIINESKNTSDLIKEIKLRRNTMGIEDESRSYRKFRTHLKVSCSRSIL